MPAHPQEIIAGWHRQTVVDRVSFCVSMLYCHGFLSDKERVKVSMRVRKWLGRYEGVPVSKKKKK